MFNPLRLWDYFFVRTFFGREIDRNFASFLETQVQKDLEFIRELNFVPLGTKSYLEPLLENLRERYKHEKICPTFNYYEYNYASRELRERYNQLHKEICNLLYSKREILGLRVVSSQ